MAQHPDNVEILALAEGSDVFRRTALTGEHLQIVVMTLQPGEEIGEETHPDTDQVLYFVAGEGEAVLDGETSTVTPGRLVLVRAGVRHNFVNSGTDPLRLITAYAPPEHPDGTVHATKQEADADEHDH